MRDILEESIVIMELYDMYQSLLTEKQKEYIEAYYFDDLSLTEISENVNVSRNAVHDLLKRSVHKLYDFEEKLHLREKEKKRTEIIDNIDQANQQEELQLLIDALKKVE